MSVRAGVALRLEQSDATDGVEPPAESYCESDWRRYEHVNGVHAGLRSSLPDHVGTLIGPCIDVLPSDRLLIGASVRRKMRSLPIQCVRRGDEGRDECRRIARQSDLDRRSRRVSLTYIGTHLQRDVGRWRGDLALPPLITHGDAWDRSGDAPEFVSERHSDV